MKRIRDHRVQLHEWWRRPSIQRFSRYFIGSVVAFGASEVVFLTVYGLRWASPQVATVWSFAAGIPTNYLLNRRWTWQRRGLPPLRSELLPYAAIVSISVVSSAVGTAAMDRWLQSVTLPRAAEILLVGATFAAINGGLFLAKYVLLDRLVFRRPGHRRVHDVEPVP